MTRSASSEATIAHALVQAPPTPQERIIPFSSPVPAPILQLRGGCILCIAVLCSADLTPLNPRPSDAHRQLPGKGLTERAILYRLGPALVGIPIVPLVPLRLGHVRSAMAARTFHLLPEVFSLGPSRSVIYFSASTVSAASHPPRPMRQEVIPFSSSPHSDRSAGARQQTDIGQPNDHRHYKGFICPAGAEA